MEVLGLTQKELVSVGIVVPALGYFGQWLKSIKDFPTWLAHLCIGLSVIAAWALVRLPVAGHIQEWLLYGVAFAMAASGVSSWAAGTRLAPKTDSK